MCIIIHKPAKKTISSETLFTCYSKNSDGIGMVYADNGKLKIYKTLRYEKFLKQYNKIKHLELLIHFRYATHGNVNIRNVHGFKLNDNLAFVHNGIISEVTIPKNSDITDSEVFGKQILKNLPDGWIDNKAIIELLESFLSGSKIALMDNKGNVTILNKRDGIIDNGIWYSNTGFRTYYAKPNFYNWKPNHYRFTRCTKCNIHLMGNEKETGICKNCEDKEEPELYCLVCNDILETEKEKSSGLCIECYYKITNENEHYIND